MEPLDPTDPQWSSQFKALADSLGAFGMALAGEDCSSLEIVELACVVQYELNRRFGWGNRHVRALVKLVGHALPTYAAEMPSAVLCDMATLMRQAAGQEVVIATAAPLAAAQPVAPGAAVTSTVQLRA